MRSMRNHLSSIRSLRWRPRKAKSSPKLQEEVGEAVDEGLLQLRLGVFVLEVEEFEDERVLDCFFGCHRVAGLGGLGLLQHGGFVV